MLNETTKLGKEKCRCESEDEKTKRCAEMVKDKKENEEEMEQRQCYAVQCMKTIRRVRKRATAGWFAFGQSNLRQKPRQDITRSARPQQRPSAQR